jgi:aerobic carbon-monoxide dehydrogenase large subunit
MAPYLGQSINKLDDPVLVRGEGTFVDDIKFPNMLYVGFVRSPYAHAEIINVDYREALARTGVLAAFNGQEVKKMLKPYPVFHGLVRYTECYPLAVERVNFVGEPVVAVLADDPYTLADALDDVQIDYKPLPVVSDPEKALQEDSPLLYPDWGNNIMFKFRVKGGDIDLAFEKADLKFKDTIEIHRYTGAPMEPRAYAANYEHGAKTLTYWASTQQAHVTRSMLADALDFPEKNIRVIQPNVGGGFGLKTPIYPEEALICLTSMKLRRPVKWTETRREHMVATGHAREQKHYIEVAARKDGVVLGIRDKMIVDLGVFYPSHGQMQMFVTAKYIVGPYAIRNVDIDAYGVATNKTYYYAYRGFGKEAANFVYEGIMDRVARELGLDRAEVRFRNFIPPDAFPYKTGTGCTYDSGNYPAVLKKALDAADYPNFAKMKSEARKQGRYLGLGISYVLEPSASAIPNSYTQGYDATTIRVDPAGNVTVLTGVSSAGSGNETGIAQAVADEIGVNIDDVTVTQGDTAICPYGLGNYSSRSSVIGLSSAVFAARKIRAKIVKAAAHMLEARAEDLEIDRGRVFVRGSPAKSITIRDVARKIYRDPYTIPNLDMGLDETYYFLEPNIQHSPDEEGNINTYPNYPNGANIALIEVDPKSGDFKILKYIVVHDCGTVINPSLVEGQIMGGVIQGLGGAVYEELLYDENGQLLTSSFMDYLIPSIVETPPMTILHHVTKCPFTPLGQKGCGEGGAEGVSSALISALEDGLHDYNVRIRKSPLKPEFIWGKISEGSHNGGRTDT